MTAVQVLFDEDMIGNAERRGDQFLRGLQSIHSRCPLLKGVRGRGLMLAVELDVAPDNTLAWDLCLRLADL
eukprot:gene60079-80123_t